MMRYWEKLRESRTKRPLIDKNSKNSGDETKKKIAAGVRQGWERRRGIMMVQERCLFEWQNMVAEASRKGYAGEVELQWDSYKIIDEQLKQMWLESIEKRKSMPRPKGSKRAPKSLEQRRKISEAIVAKWADPEYRNRVRAALSKYHGTLIGSGKKPRRKPTGQTSPEKCIPVKKKSEQTAQLNFELKNLKQVTHKKRKNSAPSFKDPMSTANLELLKKIKADRTEMETKKREATMRAKLLIAEAERAANALEEAALRSPLAKASLLKTRKLIAEANLSLKSIESGRLMARESAVEAHLNSHSDGSKKTLQINMTTRINKAALNEKLVNGFHNLCSTDDGDEVVQHRIRYGVEVDEVSETARGDLPPSYHPKRAESDGEETTAIDRSDFDSRMPNDSKMGSTRTRKWVCGRFVEAED